MNRSANASEMLIYMRSGAGMGPLLLLDRDGTINVDFGYISDPDNVKLLPGAAEGLLRIANAGFQLAIVTNQSGVGRGMFSACVAETVTRRLISLLAEERVDIVAAAACYHGPDEGCACRKPTPGLALEIAGALGLSLDGAIVVGDKSSDVGLAKAIGARAVLIAARDAPAIDYGQDATRGDLLEAADIILGWMKADAARIAPGGGEDQTCIS